MTTSAQKTHNTPWEHTDTELNLHSIRWYAEIIQDITRTPLSYKVSEGGKRVAVYVEGEMVESGDSNAILHYLTGMLRGIRVYNESLSARLAEKQSA